MQAGLLAIGRPAAAARERRRAPIAAISGAALWPAVTGRSVRPIVPMTACSPSGEAATTCRSALVRKPVLSPGIARLASTEANTSKPNATLAAAPVPVSVIQAARSRCGVLIWPPPATARPGPAFVRLTGQRRRLAGRR